MKRKEDGKNKRTLREDVKMIVRGMRIVLEISTQYIIYSIMSQIMYVVSIYFTLYMSAQLVNELAGQCDSRRLVMLAGITVLGQFAFKAANRIVETRLNIWQETRRIREELYMFDKQHGLEYEHLENPDVTLLREKIYGAAVCGACLRTSALWWRM